MIAGGNRNIADSDNEPGRVRRLRRQRKLRPGRRDQRLRVDRQRRDPGRRLHVAIAVRLRRRRQHGDARGVRRWRADGAERSDDGDDHGRRAGQPAAGGRRSPAATAASAIPTASAGETVSVRRQRRARTPTAAIASYQWSVNGQIVGRSDRRDAAAAAQRRRRTPFSLVVTDNDGDRSAPAAVTITVQASNPGPTVTIEGGSRSVPDGDETPGELVPFSGSATDPNGVDAAALPLDRQRHADRGGRRQANPTLALAEGSNIVTLTRDRRPGRRSARRRSASRSARPTRSRTLPGLTPNQESTANATEDTCSRLLKADPVDA